MRRAVGYTASVAVVLSIISLLVQACQNDAAGPSNRLEPQVDNRLLVSSAGYFVPVDRMQANLKEVTRGVAMALNDPLLRGLVYREIHQSPFREGKLHLRPFLTGSGADLLTAVATRTGSSVDGVLQKLDSIIDLEFYMPVDAHREKWGGGPDLLVATVLRDDGTIPTAFDLSGRAVPLTSADVPPDTPTLAVVPRETDFSRVPQSASGGQPMQVTSTMTSTPGIHLTRAFIADDYEGFMMGDPEFEMHVFVGAPSDTLADLSCAGEHASGDYEFDQDNNEVWSGDVLLYEPETGDSARHVIMMWENDADACEFPDSDGRPPKTESGTIWQYFLSEVGGVVTTLTNVLTGAWEMIDIGSWTTNVVTFWQKDDPVGVVDLPSCFATESGSERYWLRNAGTNVGWVDIDFQGESRTPLCGGDPPSYPPSPPAFSVELVGNYEVPENTECGWYANASNGTPPYTYAWYRDGNQVGTSMEYTGNTYTSDFTLIVFAFHSGWGFAADTLNVTVSDLPFSCLIP